MIRKIDALLNKVTMYRLVVYELCFLLAAAMALGFFGILSYNPAYIAFSAAFIFSVCWITNAIFAFSFDAPSNPESTWITGLILALIITPPDALLDPRYLPLAFWAAACAVASKYLFAIGKKHLFNPAAFGVAATALLLGLSASWWVGTLAMAPFVLAGGLLIVRKIRRFDMWWAFLGTFTAGVVYFSFHHGLNLGLSLSQSLIYAPAFFFASVMLTEPATSPPARIWRILYGAGIGFLFLPNVGFGSFFFSPELALLFGNLCAYIVSPKEKLTLKLKEKIRLSKDVYEFVFTRDRYNAFRPGQYMEWTLAHAHADSRSVRRYFTIASSPTERDIRLGVKFYAPSSSFKKALFSMQPGDAIVASQLSGDFTLPMDTGEKLVFIAGGIGITPFRSMIRYLLDKGEKRPITILYANKTPPDAVYRDLLDRAEQELGIRTVYAFTDADAQQPVGSVRAIDPKVVAREVPDYKDRTFYISGPQGMVTSFKDMLIGIGVARTDIKTDYFPGFA